MYRSVARTRVAIVVRALARHVATAPPSPVCPQHICIALTSTHGLFWGNITTAFPHLLQWHWCQEDTHIADVSVLNGVRQLCCSTGFLRLGIAPSFSCSTSCLATRDGSGALCSPALRVAMEVCWMREVSLLTFFPGRCLVVCAVSQAKLSCNNFVWHAKLPGARRSHVACPTVQDGRPARGADGVWLRAKVALAAA